MKNFNFRKGVIAVLALAAIGCTKKEEGGSGINLDRALVTMDYSGGTPVTITVEAASNWTAAPSVSWITLSDQTANSIVVSVEPNNGVERDGEVVFTAGDANRRARIDGDSATLSDLSARLRTVWLTPREDRLFVDGAAERRAFFDRLAASFDAAHAGRCARLSKLMSERAFALKNGRDVRWLDALDAQIAGVAVSVADARVRYAGELNYFLTDCAVTVSGMVEQMLIDGCAASAERRYLEYLHGARELIGDKMVVDGPHKSDFGVFNKRLNLPAALTSTGQQKTVLLDLILAHAKLIHTKTHRRPLILLDEAAAHLDADARARLFRDLGAADAQVWATGLDANVFADVPDAVFVACKDGEINNILVPGNTDEQD